VGKTAKLAIIVALAAAIVAVVALRRRQRAKSPGGQKPGPEDQATGLPRLIDFGAGMCIPCKLMAPILEELKEEYQGRLEVVVIDVNENKEAVKEYNVKIIPLQVFLDPSGRELFRHEGFFSKEDILAKWKELGYDFAAGDAKSDKSAAEPQDTTAAAQQAGRCPS